MTFDFNSFIEGILKKQSRAPKRKPCRIPRKRRLRFEKLEDRALLNSVSLVVDDAVACETGVMLGNVSETPDPAVISLIRADSEFSGWIGLRLENAAVPGSDYTLWREVRTPNLDGSSNIIYEQVGVSGPFLNVETGMNYYTASIPMSLWQESATLQARPVNDNYKETSKTATITLDYYQVNGSLPESVSVSGSCSFTINDNDDWDVSVSASSTVVQTAETPEGSSPCNATINFTRFDVGILKNN